MSSKDRINQTISIYYRKHITVPDNNYRAEPIYKVFILTIFDVLPKNRIRVN